MSGYYPAGVTTKMIDERYEEPKGPFNVEAELPAGLNLKWDLWAYELEDYQEAVSQAQILVDHHWGWRIVGKDGREYRPNLLPRKAA